MSIKALKRRVPAVTFRARAAAQDKAFVPADQFYAACPSRDGVFSTAVTHAGMSFSVTLELLRKSNESDVIFASGFSTTTVDYSIRINSNRLRLRLNHSTGPKEYDHPTLLPTSIEGWQTVSFGWDSVAQEAFITLDGDREPFPHSDFVVERQQRFFIGGSSVGNAARSFEVHGIYLALNGGSQQISYLCDSDDGNVCADSNANNAGAFDGITYGTGDLPSQGIAQTPALAIPEAPPPEPPTDNVFTASSTDSSATYDWWHKPNNGPNAGAWVPALPSLDATQSGASNETLTINSADINDAGKIAPMAYTAAYPNGKMAEVVADLVVIDPDTPVDPPDTAAPVLLYSDIVSGKKSGWSAADPDLGCAVTVWGHRLGSALAVDTYIEVYDGTQWVKLDAARHYPETWGEYNKPIPWLQSVCFHLTSAMADSNNALIRITVADKPSNTLPFAVHDEGNIYHIDYDNGDDDTGDGTYEDPHKTLANYHKAIGAGDSLYLTGTTTRREHMHKTNSDSGGRLLRFVVPTSAPMPTEHRTLNIVARPGTAPHFAFHENDGETTTGFVIKQGLKTETPYTCVSKLKLGSDYQTIDLVSTGPVGGYCRAVGNDVTGCHRKDGGTGIIKTADSPYNTYDQDPGSEGQSSGHKIFGNNVYGARTMNRYDHYIYLAGNSPNEGGEVAYNYCHDGNIGFGPGIAVNHQQPRVGKGQKVSSHIIHHNYIDARQAAGGWPPEHDPAFNDYMQDEVEKGNQTAYPWVGDDTYHDEAHCVAIGLVNDGYHESQAPEVVVSDPMYVYCNVIVGANEARRPNPRKTSSGPSTPALINTAMAGGGVIFNNLFIDWYQEVHIDGQWPMGPHGYVPYTWINNAYVFSADPVTPGTVYGRTLSRDEVGSTNNLFWANAAVDRDDTFGSSPVFDHDPQYVLSTTPGEKAVTMNNGDIKGAGLPDIPPNIEYDFNGVLYIDGSVTIGPVQYEEP